MKRKYDDLELEIVIFDAEDIITASGDCEVVDIGEDEGND